MKHDNDNIRSSGGATPLGTRLARAGRREDLQRLIDYGRVTVVSTWIGVDGNLPEAGGNALQVDRVTEIRPSPDEIVALAAQDAAGARDTIGPFTPAELAAASERRLRRDASGQITDWLGSDNRWHPFAELFRQPKGSRRKSEQQHRDDNARHLAIRASGGLPEPSRYVERNSDGADYWRLRHALLLQTMTACNHNRRQDIDRIGVGSGASFDEAWANAGLYPACRIPRHMTVIARGAEFMAYRVHSNPRAAKGSFVGPPDAVERQIVETIDQPRIDAALGEHATVLDLSTAGLTAREIAAKMGWGDTKAAERRAVAAQDAALAALANVEERLAA